MSRSGSVGKDTPRAPDPLQLRARAASSSRCGDSPRISAPGASVL